MTSTTPKARHGDDIDGIDDLVSAVLVASRVLVGVSARSLQEAEDSVTVAQFRTLVVLHSQREINLNGLAERLGVNASTAVRMVDKLVSAGFVSRQDNPENRREVQLSLTPAGARLVERVTSRRRAEIARIVTAMPAARRGQLVAALDAFAAAADEPPVAGGVTAFGW